MKNEKEFSYYTYKVGRYIKSFLDNDDFKPYKETNDELVWNIIDHDFNAKKMVVSNLFKLNWKFNERLVKLSKDKKYKDNYIAFADEVRSLLQYHFWSKCEYEIVVNNWVSKETEEKIDVYTQVMMNWDNFIHYLWENRKLIKKL